VSDKPKIEQASPYTGVQWLPMPLGKYPTKGRQTAIESNVSASLCVRQTPEMFGGISTD
jgi:hypothetical protein